MPPKTQTRHAAGQGKRNADDSGNVSKPNLPRLAGISSARRNYSYGAETEPAPYRPGKNLLEDEVLDLSWAVNDAKARHKQAEEDEEVYIQRPPRTIALPTQSESDADELAGDPKTQRRQSARESPRKTIFGRAKITSAPMAPLREPTPENSDEDDARSFAIESEFFGDATIASTPGVEARVQQHRLDNTGLNETAQRFNPFTSRPIAFEPPSQPHIASPTTPTSDYEDQSRIGPAPTARIDVGPTVNDSPARPPVTGLLSDPPRRRRRANDLNHVDDVSESESSNGGWTKRARRRGKRTQPSTTSAGEAPQSTEKDEHSAPKHRLTPKPTRRRGTASAAKPSFLDEAPARLPLSQRSGNGHKTHDSGKWFTVNNNISHRPSLFEKAKHLAVSASPFLRGPTARSDLHEQNDELQDVGLPTEQAATQAPWHQRWAWLRQVPLILSDALPENEDNDAESTSSGPLSEEHDEFRWWQLLNPYTYFQLLLWAASTAYDSLLAGLDALFPQTTRDGFVDLFGRLLYLLAFCVGFLTLAGVLQGSFYSFVDEDFTLFPNPSRFQWPDVGGVLDNMQDFLPSLSIPAIPAITIPSISWPTWRSSGSLPPEWRLRLANISDPEEYFKAYTQDLDTLKANAEMHDASLQKLNAILPNVVHMELRDGRPVISADFWHALFELVKQDDRFVLFDKVGQSYQMKSEKQLKALAAQIGSDPMFSKKLDDMSKGLENQLRTEQAAQWTAWLRNNERNVGSNQTNNLVSKDVFLAILHDELATHRRDIQDELAKMRPDLDKLVRDAAQMVSQTLPEGMSRGQITTLVHSLVQKYIADVNLGAVAKGKIHAHWDSVLKHQINYAAVGSGAIVDVKHSSESYKRSKELNNEDRRRGLAVEMTQPQIAALLPWREDGECWCARRSKSRRGNPHGAALSVLLSQHITPQYLAVEHILPWATVDPGARPKNLEVYADVDESIRARLRDFAITQFPDDTTDWDFTPPEFPERFVKIGQFIYKDVKRDGTVDAEHQRKEDEELPDEVQVFQFSSELAELGLETDQVIVRATSNYGARDHTCFYRVRLFGKAVDDEATWERASS